jgi:hypothetical protein
VDNRLGDGGFSCVPGFNQVLRDYAEKTAQTDYAKKMEKEYAFVEVTEGKIFLRTSELLSFILFASLSVCFLNSHFLTLLTIQFSIKSRMYL